MIVVAVDIDRQEAQILGRVALCEDVVQAVGAFEIDKAVECPDPIVACERAYEVAIFFRVALDHEALPIRRCEQLVAIGIVLSAPRAEFDAEPLSGLNQLDEPRDNAVFTKLRGDVLGIGQER